MAVERSDKLKWQVYEPSVYEAPYLVYYMVSASDSYTSSGYSFNIKTPALGAFLDPEAYISYKLRIKPKVLRGIKNLFATHNTSTETSNSVYPQPVAANGYVDGTSTNDTEAVGGAGGCRKFAFRQGNIMQRATQQIVCTINGFTLNAEPWKWIDPLNRIMVSQSQSKHVFSGSGGAFDSGNHGVRNRYDNQYVMVDSKGAVNGYIGANSSETWAAPSASIFQANIQEGFNHVGADGTNWYNYRTSTLTAAANKGFTMLRMFPDNERFYNPGFTDRIDEMIRKIRGDVRDGISTGITNNCFAAFNGNVQTLYQEDAADTTGGFNFIVWEPIPLPPFKMYHNDGVGGIIPHVRDMTLRATFTANLLANIFMATYDVDAQASIGGFTIDWSTTKTSDCSLYLKWYLPPPSITIPREISIPLRKIDMYLSTSAAKQGAVSNSIVAQVPIAVSQYNISLDAVPDLLLIYYRIRNDTITTIYPCDYCYEMQNLTIQLENNGGKLTQIQPYQCYQNWLKYIKFDDPVEMTYDEFRKNCFVAALKPDDYGVIRGPGWDNVVVLGVGFNAVNYHVNPSINLSAGEDLLLYDDNSTPTAELVVVAIYDRWHLTLSADGTARANLTRIRDIGNPLPSANMGMTPGAAM